MERDLTLLALRAAIAFDPEKAVSEEERFQGQVLRPILKFQNSLLLAVAASKLAGLGNRYHLASVEGKKALIREILAKDVALGQLLTGITLALFTSEEYQQYQGMPSAVNKRLKALVTQRLETQLDALDSLLRSLP